MATVSICDRWQCNLCYKSYSSNCPFKKHLENCLVHRDNNAIMMQLKNELLAEFKTELNKTLSEIRNGIVVNAM